MMATNTTGSVLVVAEHDNRTVAEVTYEAAGFASKVADATAFNMVAMCVIGHPVEPLAKEVHQRTAYRVLGFDTPQAQTYQAHVYRSVLTRVCRLLAPRFICVPHTSTGLDFGPSLAVDLGAVCITGVSDFTITEHSIAFTRQICNGKLYEEVTPPPHRMCIITVMPGAASPISTDGATAGDLSIEHVDICQGQTRTIGYIEPDEAPPDLLEAEVIVAGGRGLKDPQYVELLKELASLFRRGAVGCSRPLCDMGWLPFECQVGMTGHTVSPKLYIACGISGAMHHTMGMRRSDTIIAITTDRNAAICDLAHYCVMADVRHFLPLLIEHLKHH